MKVAFDVHGTLDRNPQLIMLLMKTFEHSGHEVCIISGPPVPEIYKELQSISREFFNPYIQNVFSIVDFIKLEGVPMTKDEKGHWFCDDFYWWRSKGLICQKHDIDMLIDNELRYKKHMPKGTNFVHWDRRNFNRI